MSTKSRKGWYWKRREDWQASSATVGHFWSHKLNVWLYVCFLGTTRGWAWRKHATGWIKDGFPNATLAMEAAEAAKA